jgi:RNA ligase (TIGR02306 family)
MSTHTCEVVPVALSPHPNADSLSLVFVRGWTVVVKTDEWLGKDKGIYIPPDSVVPDTPDWAWLDGHRRIRAKKFRGIISLGMLIPAPPEATLGEDYMERLGIAHYEPPPEFSTYGERAQPPTGYYPVYDVENLQRYPHVFRSDELVVATEKVHGTSFRAVWHNGGLHVSSHTEWKKQSEESIYWQVLEVQPIEKFCWDHPGVAVYGEIYGNKVQSLHYGRTGIDFVCFDLWEHDHWMERGVFSRILADARIPTPPVVYYDVYDTDALVALSIQDSLIPGANHMREGIVIKAVPERNDPEIGRAQLKLVSSRYLLTK